MGDAEAALSGWRRALGKEGVWSKELLFDKENLKFLIKRVLFWEKSSPEQEGALQRLKHPGNTIQAQNLLMDPQELGNLWQYQSFTAILEKRLVLNFILN